jgi:PAS domain S-box-containing protein
LGWGVIETRHRTKSGRIIDVEVSTLPDAGQRNLIAFIRDITVRKQAELELRRTRDRLEAMLTAMPDLMFHITRDGTILDFRSANPNQLYCPPEHFLGKPLREVLPQPACDIIMGALATAASEGTVHGVSYSLPLPQGVTWFELSAARMQMGETDNPEVILLVRDITARKQQEEQLRLSEQRHRILAESLRDVVWAMRPDGVITYVSPAVEQVRGYTPEEALRQPIEQILAPAARASAVEYLESLGADLQAGRPPRSYRGEQEYYRKDGSIFWAEVTAVPLLREDGTLVELIGVSRDIDERKRYEQDLKQARDAADRANAAKSLFLAHMSHEIRTPMNAVLGLTQLLEREPLTPGQAAMIRHIGEAGDSLLRIINDILDFSKIEAGELRVDHRDFEPAAILRQLDNLLGTTARRKGIELVISSAELPEWLVGDDQRLEQILINLIGNAIKFTEHGSVTLAVRPVASDDTTVRLRFEVRDTGIGIDAEGLSRLFQPFSQADSSITRRFGGTGLGLAICRRLAGLMGGTLGADSIPGQGSTFWLELPLGRSTTVHQPPSAAAPPADAAPAGERLAGMRVLLVDDNRINLMVATKALEREGARVETAGDGQQALDRLRAGPGDFDVVLMDIQMPVMDGLTATREIRRDAALAGLPVIALTAGVLPEEHQAALDAGINDVLNKPLELDKMTSTLRRVVGPVRSGDAP